MRPLNSLTFHSGSFVSASFELATFSSIPTTYRLKVTVNSEGAGSASSGWVFLGASGAEPELLRRWCSSCSILPVNSLLFHLRSLALSVYNQAEDEQAFRRMS